MNVLKISLRWGVRSPIVGNNEFTINRVYANLKPATVTRSYSQISSQKVKYLEGIFFI